ncbi:MAG: hypothetical protein SOW25_02215 [Helicobacter sp.]|nr:hypothetical protein [Helicobacteraceae bacterium]MDY3113125.1 hypothetical protein [Helicobacter sp.]
MKEAKIYKELKLDDTEKGKLEFAIILEPYGENSKPVVSIESKISETQAWKVHIPLTQLKATRKALKEAKAAYKKYSKASKKAKKEEANTKKATTKKNSKKTAESCADKKCKKDNKQNEAKN